MSSNRASPLAPWGRVDCILDLLCRAARLQEPRGQDFDINSVQQRSGIAPSTFWRLITNRSERIGLEPLARCCTALQIDITDLLLWRVSHHDPICLPQRSLVSEPITDPGQIKIVLGKVLDGYAEAFGEPLHLADLIQLPSLPVEATIAGKVTQIDLPILERAVAVLTMVASKPSNPAHQFNDWLHSQGYKIGTVGLVLRYEPPERAYAQSSS